MSIILRSGRVIDTSQNLDAKKDILIEGSMITAVSEPGQIPSGTHITEINCEGKIVSPGLVDIHVHLREPGQEWKETIQTGCEAAVAGGFTDVCCMPNTKPVNDSRAVTEFILEKARNAACTVHPIGAITMGSKGEAMAPFAELWDSGCVAFSDDGRPVMNAQVMRRALEYCGMLGAVLTVHEEDLTLSDGFSMNESALSLSMGLKGMPDAAENVMIARDIELSRLTGSRVHFCHVSTARGVTLIRRAKEDGIPVTAETAPHYLYLNESAVDGFNTHAKMSMPLRKDEDIQALLEGLADGVIDCIASDHAPHEADSKNVEFDKASFGILGLQTTVPIMLTLVREGKLDMVRMIDALTTRAWKSINKTPRTIRPNMPAHLSVLDPHLEVKISKELNKSKSFNTPFIDHSFIGAAYMTIVDGKIKFRHA